MVLYINLEISNNDKNRLNKIFTIESVIKNYCYLARKGGNVIKKAHITLGFGIDRSEYNKLVLDNKLKSVENEFVSIQDVDMFRLNKCNAIVAILSDKRLYELNNYFLANYFLDNRFTKQKFKPHITLFYVRKDFNFIDYKNNLFNFKIKIKIQKAIVKYYGPR